MIVINTVKKISLLFKLTKTRKIEALKACPLDWNLLIWIHNAAE